MDENTFVKTWIHLSQAVRSLHESENALKIMGEIIGNDAPLFSADMVLPGSHMLGTKEMRDWWIPLPINDYPTGGYTRRNQIIGYLFHMASMLGNKYQNIQKTDFPAVYQIREQHKDCRIVQYDDATYVNIKLWELDNPADK